MTVRIVDLPEVAATASLHFRDELLGILGTDLVSAWLHGGTTFVDRPLRSGDLDICVVIASAAPDERSPRTCRRDPGSRPSRIYASEESLAREHGVEFDTMYLLADEVGRARLPSSAFDRNRRETGWAVYRAHWLAGQYVLLHGPPPEDLITAPTNTELRRALDREVEHLERHAYEGDAEDPHEATYAILNGCRILYTLETGSPVLSKRSAGAWGVANLPRRWRGAIHAAIRSYDGTTSAEDNEMLHATMAPFVDIVRERLPKAKRHRPGPPRWS